MAITRNFPFKKSQLKIVIDTSWNMRKSVILHPCQSFRSVQNSKLKLFAEDKLSVAEMTDDNNNNTNQLVGKAVGKGENTDYQHFLFFPKCFNKPSHLWGREKSVLY